MADYDEEEDYFNIPPIPSEIVFPLELSRFLKGQLSITIEENWHLKKFIEAQENELKTLRQKAYATTVQPQALKPGWSSTAEKLSDLKKSRIAKSSEMEGLRAKVKGLKEENDALMKKVKDLEADLLEKQKIIDKEKDIMNSSQLLTQTTNKVMEYRQKFQMALSQEVGEGTTPQNVLSITATPNWRGRQQQILALQLKVTELTSKLSFFQQQQQKLNFFEQFQQGGGGCHDGGGDACSGLPQIDNLEFTPKSSGRASPIYRGGEGQHERLPQPQPISAHSSASQWTLSSLQKQERKKQNQFEKTSQELEELKRELHSTQEKMRGLRARSQTLESQLRTSKFYVEDLEIKLRDKESYASHTNEELSELHKELTLAKERERCLREKNSEEISKFHQTLARERIMVKNLQKIIEEKQEGIKGLDEINSDLRSKLNYYRDNPGSEAQENLVRDLKSQLARSEQLLEKTEEKYTELFKKFEFLGEELEEERQSHLESRNKLLQGFATLKKADECIQFCLEAGQVVSVDALKDAELCRALIREINTGDLVSLDVSSNDVAKLKIKINLLASEVEMLKNSLKEAAEDRRRDILTFSQFAENSRKNQMSNN